MNLPFKHVFRLAPRGGGGGLSCDGAGIALGGVPLVRVSFEGGSLRSEVRPLGELGEVLQMAYGLQSLETVRRCHRGLARAAAQLEIGDLATAGIEAVLIGLPELTSAAIAKLARRADLEKSGTAWENEPRVPAGQPDGGQWTTGGGSTASNGSASGVTIGSGSRPRQVDHRPTLLDDGVYRPDADRPARVLTGGPEDAFEGFRHGIGGNEPPYDFMELSELFPGLRNEPGVAIPLAPVDAFLGISSAANALQFGRDGNRIREAIGPNTRARSSGQTRSPTSSSSSGQVVWAALTRLPGRLAKSERPICMARKYQPYIPQTLGELLDKMGFMLLSSPTFIDKSGYFPGRDVETSFYGLNEGLRNLRPQLGEELYQKLRAMSDQMRAYFEADPERTTGDTLKGKQLALDMEELIEARWAELRASQKGPKGRAGGNGK